MELLKNYIAGRIIRSVHSDVHGNIVLVSIKWWRCEICKTHSAEERDARIMEINNEIRAKTGAKYRVLTDENKLDDTYRKYFPSSNPHPRSDIKNDFYIYEWNDRWNGYF